MKGLKKACVLDAIKVIISQNQEENRQTPPVLDYEAKFVSKKILRAVLSYIDYINRTVWFKK